MRLRDAQLKDHGLTWTELELCPGCQPTQLAINDTSGFVLCQYHKGFADGFEQGRLS